MAATADSGGGGPAPVMSVRIVSHDYYMAPPIPHLDFSFSPFHGKEIEEVPVIRIYGSTPAGQKTCLHVHKALPYLYVPCPDEIVQKPDTKKGNSYINGLMTGLEKALKTRGPSKRQHVHGCTLVKAKKIYGYYPKEELFIKIYLYYPHDVARASTVFLNGAIMDRIFQPYESHIPYLLQFLIDYNLYGMSHIHVSNMKFRPPLPEIFISKIISSQNSKEKSDSPPDNLQADCDSGAIGDLAIWTSFTVPNNLIWNYSNNENFARRQSVSMLEVDSSVDDILNEKYKMFTSLSQTSSDIKMVQSLVPIWEEFKRRGMQEDQIPTELCKPKPESVLTRFFNYSEYENILSNLTLKEENSPFSLSPTEQAERLEQCIKSLTGVCGPSSFNQTDFPTGILSKDNQKDLMNEMNEAPTSQDRKHVDEEALGLLSWLASSQAKNDLNSDDELQNEAILSPLFPKKSYELALETAHTDFEFASQKECQDILDSVERENDCVSTSSIDELIIPQVDGSTDENEHKNKTPCNKKSVKRNNRENKSVWGSLPLSFKRREISNNNATSPSFESIHDDMNWDINNNNNELNTFSSEKTEMKGLVQCSVRDLMRRKRSVQNEGCSESENPRIKLDFESCSQDLDVSQKGPCEKSNCVEMTFCEKPPIRDKVEDFDYSSEPCLNAVGPTSNDNLLPFFESGEKKENKSYSEEQNQNQNPNSQEIALGVPTHFQNDGSVLYLLTCAMSPPNPNSVRQWLLEETLPKIDTDQTDNASTPNPNLAESSKENKNMKGNEGTGTDGQNEFSQISGPDERKLTPLSQIGFRDPASVGCGQQLTIISLEVLAESRGNLRPDPKFDKINIISFCVQDDSSPNTDVYVLMRGTNEEYCRRNVDGISGCNMVIFPEERYLIEHFITIITTLDPDILIGWEIQRESLGYLAERSLHLQIPLLKQISRTPNTNFKIPKDQTEKEPEKEPSISDLISDEWGRTHASGIHVEGRIVLNLWRLMRGEVKINMYSFEAVVDEVLRRKVPLVGFRVLNEWFLSGPALGRFRCVEYFVERARVNLEMMNQLDMINRTSELARVFGIDFFSVLSRGSQFRVESMLLRLAHTQNYIAISPGSQQVATQPAMECLPLVMEPESGFYTDPVVVLDFQSLYPSMIIAYNLCYSTCLGKIFPSRSAVLGVTSSPDLCALNDIKDDLLLAPNGVLYVQSMVRKGVLPRLLNEILSTRIMVKQAMKKLLPSQQVLQRIYNARQLALKLIANVTYGYTAAGFSGRMPCAELADSIVQCGRRTLETAILFVNQNTKWKARVVYGDTDSMFVLLKGRSVEQAFKIGKEIASAISNMNPDPVTLKLEKVYKSCFLLTKKRYVGYSYESPDQKEPVFDAKGIETVRRDTCPAVAKLLERSIRIMFEHHDINKVKSYLERQWTRILSGKISLQDFIFAKEVRLGTYSAKSSTLPPSAIVARKSMQTDPRAEPQYGERVPYVVVHGEPGARLIDLVVDPYLLLDVDSPYRLNELYYVNKQIIPALQRVFGLVGADLYRWFAELARPVRRDKRGFLSGGSKGGRIDRYYKSKHCVVCGELTKRVECVCDECVKKGDLVGTVLVGRACKLEREMHHLAAICGHCGGADWIVESGVKCVSLACPVFYERRKVQKELKSLAKFAGDAGFYPHCMVELF